MENLQKLILKAKPENFEELGGEFLSFPEHEIDWKSLLPNLPDQGYSRNVLIHEPIELVLLRWAPKAKSAIHWHKGFGGFVRVLSGSAFNRSYHYNQGEKTLREISRVRVHAGAGFPEMDGDIHMIENASAEDELVSLHLYFPAIKSFEGMEIFKEDGTYAKLNGKANSASWTEAKEHFHAFEPNAFEYIPFENQNASHFLLPILPKPSKEQIGLGIQDYYSAQAKIYDAHDKKHQSRNLYTEAINQLIAQNLHEIQPVGSVLHLACGTGRRAMEIRESSNLDYKITGIDANLGMCTIAGERGLDKIINDHWLNAELANDVHFDAITYLYAFGHIARKDLRLEILKKAFNHLSPGGRLYVDAFNLDDEDEWGPAIKNHFEHLNLSEYGYELGDAFYRKKEVPATAYLHYFSKPEIENLLKGAGFTIISIHQIGYAKNPGTILSGTNGHFFIVAEKPA